jgi:hypothetical protein
MFLPAKNFVYMYSIKSTPMDKNSTQLEILLITGTSFSSRQWFDGRKSSGEQADEKDMLEEALWNGLLGSMLPEICSEVSASGGLYLWQIKAARHLLEIEIGEFPESRDAEFSIDPYTALAPSRMN